MSKIQTSLVAGICAFIFTGCGGSREDGKVGAIEEDNHERHHAKGDEHHDERGKVKHEEHHEGAHGGHLHQAPHGGTLVVFGEEFAHLEFVLDAAAGKLTAYVLDGEARKAQRLKQGVIDVHLTIGGKEKELSLTGVASELTGETAGDTSQFELQADALKGVTEFKVEIPTITIKGIEFKAAFRFPDGNEANHHDDEVHNEKASQGE
ncbi:MAG: hypothetical protein QF437_13230 [Planctomycetota bacterium]|jgi:hypothetical protein|nr:hypothetical protein [Planctomycetota bacterium]MDP7131451.1 hypothetical protein [Planctomycetota bacterium]MDP7248926.1 hypothetical protein [Planctomycetota bacterium]